jgi:hypothetical protein
MSLSRFRLIFAAPMLLLILVAAECGSSDVEDYQSALEFDQQLVVEANTDSNAAWDDFGDSLEPGPLGIGFVVDEDVADVAIGEIENHRKRAGDYLVSLGELDPPEECLDRHAFLVKENELRVEYSDYQLEYIDRIDDLDYDVDGTTEAMFDILDELQANRDAYNSKHHEC